MTTCTGTSVASSTPVVSLTFINCTPWLLSSSTSFAALCGETNPDAPAATQLHNFSQPSFCWQLLWPYLLTRGCRTYLLSAHQSRPWHHGELCSNCCFLSPADPPERPKATGFRQPLACFISCGSVKPFTGTCIVPAAKRSSKTCKQ